ncbi:Disease resistance protein RPM1 [Camellia lanceoleosa]|uniref:Disease resistance protein RPM1 n=1 Tax=Camellia lanceoleosa TaxID=1840588 RepID=A0ACC0FKR1_9ERIC|nr:Disease resistance protein RPM1 [Camellia lanceoleosa]
MAETAVFPLLANLAPFLQGEVNLLSGVREAMEDIRDEFERMSAFLRVADATEERDPELKVWVKQVRDAAYDTEYVLDKFKLHLAQDHGDGCLGFLRKVFYFATTLIARHQIASELQRIKSRVINISEGHKRYHDKYGIPEEGSRSNVVNNSWHDYRGDALLLEEAKLVGIEMPKRQLMEWLVEGDSGLKAVSVVGMGGLGKTTLVKKVYDDATAKKHFDSHAWLTVSESLRAEDLLKDMIQQLFKEIMQPVPVGVETMSINRLKCLANDFLQQRRYVVVFDDVWNVNAWEAIKHVLPDNNCGSRVILTTRFAHIASTCCKETDVEEDPWLKAISLVGMGGLGKTTLVKQVYDDTMVKNHFNSHAWLTVSESIRIEDLMKDMIPQLFSEIMQPVPFGVETMSINRLK